MELRFTEEEYRTGTLYLVWAAVAAACCILAGILGMINIIPKNVAPAAVVLAALGPFMVSLVYLAKHEWSLHKRRKALEAKGFIVRG